MTLDEVIERKREYENIQRWLNIAKRCHEENDPVGELLATQHLKWRVKRLFKSIEGAKS